MQTVAARPVQRLAARRAVRVAAPRVVRVVCQAQKNQTVAKLAAAATALPALLAASPAFALVDERLNGDGTGRPLGVNDGALTWVLVIVPLLIWIVWFTSQRELGDFEDKDSGLNL